MCWLYSSIFHSKKFTKAGGSFYTAVADLKLWQSVHRFHGNAELNCIYVGKPMPRGLSHSARSSSYGSFEHLLFQNTTFLLHQGLQYASCYRCLLFYSALRQRQSQSHSPATSLVSREERESTVWGANTEGRQLRYIYNLEPLMQTETGMYNRY